MILSPPEDIQRYQDAGLWIDDPETATLDGLLRRNAIVTPDKVAIADAPDRSRWSSEAPRSLSWSALDQEVDALALFFHGLGLSKDAVIAIYGPNTVDMVASILAVHRAGFIAAPLPLFWRETEMRDYLSEVQARVIITASRLEDDFLALRCRSVSQDLFSIKFLLGFGNALPDGVVDLRAVLDAVTNMMDTRAPLDPIDPNAVLSVHPTTLQSVETESVLPRSSNQWLCAERSLFGEGSFGDVTLCPFVLSGFVGFCAGLVRTLKNGGTLHLQHFQTHKNLARAVEAVKPDFLVLPQSELASCSDMINVYAEMKIGCVWKNLHLASASVSQNDHLTGIFDITVLNDLIAFGAERLNGGHYPAALLLDQDNSLTALKLLERNGAIKRSQKFIGGELVVSGAAVPDCFFPTHSEKRALRRLREGGQSMGVPTRVACRVLSDNPQACEPIGFIIDVITHCEQFMVADDLDILYSSFQEVEEAAHFWDLTTESLWAAVVCTRGTELTLEKFQNMLKETGVASGKIPAHLIHVDKLPRGVGNVVLRNELFSLSQQNRLANAVNELKRTG